jgi:hypothetical protein
MNLDEAVGEVVSAVAAAWFASLRENHLHLSDALTSRYNFPDLLPDASTSVRRFAPWK